MAALSRPAIGIDLGTTKSCVGLFQDGRVEILSDAQGLRSTPSCVAFTEAGRLLGHQAESQAALNAPNTVFGAKRLLGAAAEAPPDARRWPFLVLEAEGGPRLRVSYKGAQKSFFPEEISAMILGHLKEVAEERLGRAVTHAVVTVPAHFNDSQRQATRDAGLIAGINVLRILNETTAAALAYSLHHPDGRERNVLVFDMGGGSLSASVFSIDRGVVEVKATAGDSHLGGDDFDDCLVSFFMEEFLKKHRENISHDRRAVWRLRAACEAAKRALSSSQKATVSVDCLYKGIDLQADITRAQFEQLCAKLFQRVLRPVERVLRDARLSPSQVGDVVVVGASTRMPRIRQLLQDFFGGRPLNQCLNADEAVASGAAVQAAILLEDGSDAARNLLALDVASASMGVEASTGKMHGLVKRNTAIPTVATRTFTTLHDHQPDLLIRAYEGERSVARENHLLGRFLLRGFSPAPRGMSLLEVTFYVDADGILSVFALDKVTGSANPIVVDARKGRLSKEQIARLAEEHERYRAEDRARKWKLATKNYLQSCAFSVRRTSGDILSYFTLQAKKKVVERCQQAFSWLSPATWLRRRRARAVKKASRNHTRGFKSLDNNTTGINKKRAKLIITTYSWSLQLTQTTTIIDP